MINAYDTFRWGRYYVTFDLRHVVRGAVDVIVNLDEVEGGSVHNDHPKYNDLVRCIVSYWRNEDYAGMEIGEYVQRMLGDP